MSHGWHKLSSSSYVKAQTTRAIWFAANCFYVVADGWGHNSLKFFLIAFPRYGNKMEICILFSQINLSSKGFMISINIRFWLVNQLIYHYSASVYFCVALCPEVTATMASLCKPHCVSELSPYPAIATCNDWPNHWLSRVYHMCYWMQ